MIKEKSSAVMTDTIYKWLLAVAIFLIALVIILGTIEVYAFCFKNKIYPGVAIGDLGLGGKSKEQARALILAKSDELIRAGIDFYYGQEKMTLSPIGYSEGGSSYEFWTYDLEAMVEEAYEVGRGGRGLSGWRQKIQVLFGQTKIPARYQLKSQEVERLLEERFKKFEDPGAEAKLIWEGDTPESEDEKFGKVFDYTRVMNLMEENLRLLDNQPIELVLKEKIPKVTGAEVRSLLTKAKESLALAPVTINFAGDDGNNQNKESWKIKEQEWREWLEVKDNGEGEVYLGVNEELAGKWLGEIAEIVDWPVKDARFVIQDGRVSEFQSAQDGYVLNTEETIKRLEEIILREGEREADLVMMVEKTKLNNENVNDLGIKELVASGESNFVGSSKSRIHNIGVGAAALNGLLIKPGEEFSINNALGEIDASTGYKPEMVIKGDKTIPEYGGGLCQVGTTLFRLAINAGLPITERRNHSYRVSYYEPAGTDATIYGPWPDLKFINDTGNYLLLQTRIEGTKAYFDFWGTKDGREVATTTPTIYNIVPAGETKMVETEDLKSGEKKCTEIAHNGADAYFKRTIIWPEEMVREKVEETFRSHYVPWQAVCLVGKELMETATSTEEVVGE
ncbi:MAG TPA: VanW family protein [bacterium]|nr:VanW family protein [bacterium]